MKIIDRNKIEKALSEGVIEIIFTKKDGTERMMKCTVDPAFIPEAKHPSGVSVAKSDTVKRVFDIDKQDWRSFCWDSLKECRIQ